jgi:hypothetical protein
MILILLVLFLAGCACPPFRVKIGDVCCIDWNKNGICDTNEQKPRQVQQPVNQTQGNAFTTTTIFSANTTAITPATTTITTTTTTTNVMLTDCEIATITVIEMTYYDGNNSKINAVLYNPGSIDITGIRILIYDKDGVAKDESFNMNLTALAVNEFNFDFGKLDLMNENNTVESIAIASKIAKKTCDKKYVMDFDLVDRD